MTKFVKNTRIAAAVDPVLDRAEKIAGNDHAYTNIEKMYKSEEIDAVYIATPHHLHKPMIKEALEQGKHVFCEKPVTVSVQDAREILELSKQYPKFKIGFNYQYRYDHKCYRLVQGVKSGLLGKIYYANCNVFFSRDVDYFNEGPWRTKTNTAGGGTLLIHGSHIIDVLLWALGEPISVLGKVDTLKFKKIEVEDIGFGIVEFQNGSYAQINNSMVLKPKMRLLGDLVELQIFGEQGRASYRGPWPGSNLKWRGVPSYKENKNIKGFSHIGRCIKAFANWVLLDIPFFNTVEESSRVLRLISALYKSSKTEKKEKIEPL